MLVDYTDVFVFHTVRKGIIETTFLRESVNIFEVINELIWLLE